MNLHAKVAIGFVDMRPKGIQVLLKFLSRGNDVRKDILLCDSLL
jgi:hypothetical protein